MTEGSDSSDTIVIVLIDRLFWHALYFENLTVNMSLQINHELKCQVWRHNQQKISWRLSRICCVYILGSEACIPFSSGYNVFNI